MTDAFFDPRDPGDLDTMSADIDWTDAMAARAARDHIPAGEGRLAGLHEWLAATQGAFPVRQPARVRCVVFGPVSPAVQAVCDSLDIGVRSVPVDRTWTVGDAMVAGGAAADDEADTGTDLAVVADPDGAPAVAVLVSVLTGAEPVALLPRGAQATDSADWIRRAEFLRDTRRRVSALRDRPDDLLAAIDHAPLGATAAFIARATSRRIPLVLDGTASLAAALVCSATQPRAAAWWQAADVSPDPAHARAAAALELVAVLGLGSSSGDGVAGALAVPLVRAAAVLGRTL